jgi:hypothetical protein
MQYKVNKPQVIYEIFNDEIVLINLDSGNYYSLDGVSVDIWNFIVNGDAAGKIIEAVAGSYQGKRKEMETAINQFLSELAREGLICQAEAYSGEKAVLKKSSGRKVSVTTLPVFSTPTLHRYTDMQDLLLLDPIHEVDESGWPGSSPDPFKRQE